MKAVFVKGDWSRNVVQPNLILRFIHRNQLGTVQDYSEDSDYNITMYIKNPCDTCMTKLLEEFPHYEFILL